MRGILAISEKVKAHHFGICRPIFSIFFFFLLLISFFPSLVVCLLLFQGKNRTCKSQFEIYTSPTTKKVRVNIAYSCMRYGLELGLYLPRFCFTLLYYDCDVSAKNNTEAQSNNKHCRMTEIGVKLFYFHFRFGPLLTYLCKFFNLIR